MYISNSPLNTPGSYLTANVPVQTKCSGAHRGARTGARTGNIAIAMRVQMCARVFGASRSAVSRAWHAGAECLGVCYLGFGDFTLTLAAVR